jgi:hypothetical protein
MEFMLLWWDELDDLTHAARHLAVSTATEVVDALAPIITTASAFGVWVLLSHSIKA